MATQMYQDNFGIQKGFAYMLTVTAEAGELVPKISGYDFDGTDANLTIDAEGNATFTAGGATTLIAMSTTAHELADSAGTTIEANTVDQASL